MWSLLKPLPLWVLLEQLLLPMQLPLLVLLAQLVGWAHTEARARSAAQLRAVSRPQLLLCTNRCCGLLVLLLHKMVQQLQQQSQPLGSSGPSSSLNSSRQGGLALRPARGPLQVLQQQPHLPANPGPQLLAQDHVHRQRLQRKSP